MILVLDASAIVALLTEEPAAGEVTELLGGHPSLVSAVNAAEVIDRLSRVGGLALTAVTDALSDLVGAGLHVEAADVGVATSAGRIRATRYDRSAAALSLADCFALATAAERGGTVVSSDAALCRTAWAISIPIRPVPNSSGERFTPPD